MYMESGHKSNSPGHSKAPLLVIFTLSKAPSISHWLKTLCPRCPQNPQPHVPHRQTQPQWQSAAAVLQKEFSWLIFS
jgi:hypothetical protein